MASNPKSLVDHGDGNYTVGSFDESGNEWTAMRLSSIELYLLGVAPLAEVDPIPVIVGAKQLQRTSSSVTYSGKLKTVTSNDILGVMGPRVPAAGNAKTDVRGAFALFSARPLTDAEIAWVDSQARGFGAGQWEGNMSFKDACHGRATMETALP